jgi:integrase
MRRRNFTVTYRSRAAAILRQLAATRPGDFVFLGQRKNRPLSGRAMNAKLQRMTTDAVTVHGFRSSFRDWAGNESHFPREVVETALAHVIGDKAERAYRRSDALEKRRKLMEAWAS